MTIFASMVASTGFLIPLVLPVQNSEDIMNGQCNNIVGVESDAIFGWNTIELSISTSTGIVKLKIYFLECVMQKVFLLRDPVELIVLSVEMMSKNAKYGRNSKT